MPNSTTALGDSLINVGSIFDRLAQYSQEQEKAKQEAARQGDKDQLDKQKYELDMWQTYQKMLDDRTKSLNDRDKNVANEDAANEAFRKQVQEDAKAKGVGSSRDNETSFVTLRGADPGNIHAVGDGVAGASRRVYKPGDQTGQLTYQDRLTENDIGANAQEPQGVLSSEVRDQLATNGVLSTPEGQRVLSSYYRPEHDQDVLQQRRQLSDQAETGRNQRNIVNVSKRKTGGQTQQVDASQYQSALDEAKRDRDSLLAEFKNDVNVLMGNQAAMQEYSRLGGVISYYQKKIADANAKGMSTVVPVQRTSNDPLKLF